jgi:replicative DNA helicase Mcm
MAQAENTELIDLFEEFYRDYYRNEIGDLAQKYPNERRSLFIDWQDLYRFDPDLADDYKSQPEQLQEYAEEALRMYDLPVDVSLGQAHVRVRNLPESTAIRDIRAADRGKLINVHGVVGKTTNVRPKVTMAAFECQRCGTLTRIPQSSGDFQEPHECQGCERQGPFRINFDQSEFVDAQKLRVQESPEGLRGGEKPQSIDIHIEDDITGEVTAGDHVSITGILKLDQRGNDREKSAMFDVYMQGVSVEIEDEQFEEMDITEEDKKKIVELSNKDDIYEEMVGAIAPSIYGYDQEKLSMILQLFSGVTKELPDGSKIRGDLHMLLIGDPGTGKCVAGDTRVTLTDGREVPIRDLVEANLDDPKPVDDGVWDAVDVDIPSLQTDGTLVNQQATKVWKREAPDQLYRIRTATGRELEVTPSHPLYVQSDGFFQAKTAEDLSAGTFIGVPRRVLDDSDYTDVIPDVGPELRRIREGLGFTQSDCGIPRSTYQNYERGSRNPSRESLSKVLGAFKARLNEITNADASPDSVVADGGGGLETLRRDVEALSSLVDGDIGWDRIESIETIEPEDEWVYDLEVEGTHNYLTNGVVSHNSQMLQYIRNIAPRSVYTSGKGSSSAGLTAAAVRDDFGEGQQWTLEAGALVLADQGIAAVDELDKMRCVTGDTLVQTGDSITPIRDLALDAAENGSIEELDNGRTIRDVDLDVWTMTEDGCLVQRDVTAIHEYDAPEELCEVTVETGEQLTATEDHPFFVLDDGERVEKGAADLHTGDWVYVPDELPRHAADGGVAAQNGDADVLPDIDSLPPNARESLIQGDVEVRRVSEVSRVSANEAAEKTHNPKVYDLTVEGTHNFVANGMVVHNSEDRSSMHEALEQQSISVSKAGINATLKSRCSLLGAANPKYGRFDQYEPIGEQIDLEPALISRFDLIFTVTDQPDEEKDANLAEHILQTNYAGELHTHRTNNNNSNFTEEEVDTVTDEVAPTIEPDLLRKYIAFSKRTCFPTMTQEAQDRIQEFYVDLRSKGQDEDAPVPVTARKLEALVRLAEASARVRLSDTVEKEDADRVIEIVRSCLKDIGVDPETGEFDADVVETGTSKSQRDRIKNIKNLIADLEDEYEDGAPIDKIIERAEEVGVDQSNAEHEIDKLKQQGEVYEPRTDHLRTT